VKNEEVLQGVKEERNILYTRKWRKTNWVGHILHRNCLRKHITERMTEWKRRRGKWSKLLLDGLKGGEILEFERSTGSLSREVALEEAIDLRKTDSAIK
jgi:hypothetical protein